MTDDQYVIKLTFKSGSPITQKELDEAASQIKDIALGSGFHGVKVETWIMPSEESIQKIKANVARKRVRNKPDNEVW